MTVRGSLSQRLALMVSAGFAAIWIVAIAASALALKSEQEELWDQELKVAAWVFLPVLVHEYERAPSPVLSPPLGAPEPPAEGVAEALVFVLLDREGSVLARSREAAQIELPGGPVREGYDETATHVFYTTEFTPDGYAVRFGDPKEERWEAYRDSFLAMLVPMLAIVPLGYLLVGWIARGALAPLGVLRAEIAARDGGRLDPIDAAGQAAELRAITATLNGLMARLAQALEGERLFATNAAHELRTPLAIALAQTQRLRASAGAEQKAGIERVQAALKRMTRLVARLLELARADAGIGPGDRPQDVHAFLDLVLEECRRDPVRRGLLDLSVPDGPVMAAIDADAFGIVAGNLIENAFQYGAAGRPVRVTLDAGGLSVANEGPNIPETALMRMKRRFHRQSQEGEGFGLGLHISDAIARQAGGALLLRSPLPDGTAGFEARFEFPP